MTRRRSLGFYGAATASGFLLMAAFPPLEWHGAAWFALVPLWLAARFVPPAQAMRLAWWTGFVFWVSSICWLTRVTTIGWIALSAYSALYVIPPTLLFCVWVRRFGVGSGLWNLALMFLLALTWAGFEHLRSVLFTGWPWNPLGASQYAQIALIQCARWGGATHVSALIVWVNGAAALTILRYIEGRRHRVQPEPVLALLLVLGALLDGRAFLRQSPPAGELLRAAVIQPNIPQDDKWTLEKAQMIYDRLRSLTEQALRVGPPDLIIWPETAVPDDIRNSEPSYTLASELALGGAPLLVGSMDTEWTEDGPRFYNSSFLFDTNGVIIQGYDKQHLVIFGEYIPLQRFLPFLKALTPIEESFSPGRTGTVFRLERPPVPFSVLICFEDTISALAAQAVRNGARLLINQTNDAWFDPSWASRQHMIQCVFRCIENGVPAIRCANTGVSCFIDAHGRLRDVLTDHEGQVRVAGWRAAEVRVPPDDMPLRFFTRWGGALNAAQAAAAAIVFLFALRAARRDGKITAASQ